MRPRRVATALVVLAAGLTAAAAVRRFAAGRRTGRAGSAVPAPAAPAATPIPAVRPDAVVLPFPRRAEAAPAVAAAPARCGESGGRTKAGAPCGARATPGGRCHHHRVAA